MRDNRGFSLIELIVVIAIMAILATGISAGLSSLLAWDVNKCISSIDSGLNKTKTVAMSKSSAEFSIYYESTEKAYYMKCGDEAQDKKIGKDSLTITYTTQDGQRITIDGSNPLNLQYDRSSGAYKALVGITPTTGYDAAYCKEIIVTRGSKTKKITLVWQTGKHSINE